MENNEKRTASKDRIRNSYIIEAVATAVAGKHDILFFGPQEYKKTDAAEVFSEFLSEPGFEEYHIISKLWGKKGFFRESSVLNNSEHLFESKNDISSPFFPLFSPGGGAVFINNLPEVKTSVLKILKNRKKDIKMQDTIPDFLLIAGMNVCPCGKRGSDYEVCLCDDSEIAAYWKKGAADKIDIRIPVIQGGGSCYYKKSEESLAYLKKRINRAVEIQKKRFDGTGIKSNSRIPEKFIYNFAEPDPEASEILLKASDRFLFSSDDVLAVLKTARTCSDMDGFCGSRIGKNEILKGVQMRRYGKRDIFWN